MVIERLGSLRIVKDGSSYYRVMQGRKRLGSFLLLQQASDFMKQRVLNNLKGANNNDKI